MSTDEQNHRFNALNQWFLSDLGAHIADAFSKELQPIVNLLSGRDLIQLGNCGNNIFSSQFSYQNYWIVSPCLEQSAAMFSLTNQLPFDRNSINCVVAPLSLEILSHDKNPINEIDRVLKPMGYVVFFGINPFSPWGLWLHSKKNSLNAGKLKAKSVISVKRAMQHRGYVQCHLSCFYYLPPFKNKLILNNLAIFNGLGKLLSPIPPGFYCLVMQKYEENRLLIKPLPLKQLFTPLPSIPLQGAVSQSKTII